MSVSVIIPAYNEERYLAKTLDKIKKQNFKDYELIVVCNGCTDKSFDVAKKFTDNVFQLKENNVSKARNLGADNASHGKLIFLDADVLITEGVLERIDNELDNGRFFGTAKGKGKGMKNIFYLGFKNLVNKYMPWSHGIVYCDKKSFLETGGFDENLKHGELREFFRNAKGRYKRINAYVEPSDRRIRKWGLLKAGTYWLFKKDKEEYEAIR